MQQVYYWYQALALKDQNHDRAMRTLRRSTNPTIAPMQTVKRLISALLMTAGLVGSLSGVALADGETIKGKLEKIDGDQREPVSDVSIVIEQGDETIGTAVSNDAGEWEVPVPGPGDYLVRLEVGTLPEGVSLTNPEQIELPAVNVREGQNKTVRFNLGPGITAEVTTWSRIAGLFVVGLKFGAVIALASIGLSLVFGVTGLVNFAHGELLAAGAVLAILFNSSSLGPEWHILIAALPAIALVGAFGGAQEKWLWRPLRKRGTSIVAMIVVSIGLSFAIRYIILVLMGGLPRPYQQYAVQQNIDFMGTTTVPKNLIIIGFTAVVLTLVGLFLLRTKVGTAMRAVADNSDLAESSGIDVERVILITWIMGGALAALGGVMFGISEQVQWDMGFKLLLLMFSAVILGGLGTAFGAMLGGFVVGVAVEMSTLWIAVEFKTAVALGILILMLLVRPQGLLGARERVG